MTRIHTRFRKHWPESRHGYAVYVLGRQRYIEELGPTWRAHLDGKCVSMTLVHLFADPPGGSLVRTDSIKALDSAEIYT